MGANFPDAASAQAELDARIDHALRMTHEIEARFTEEAEPEQPPPPSDEVVNRLKAFVEGYARTPEWQQVIDQIDEGDLTWRQVYEDPRRAAAAFESLSRILPPSEDKLIEIGVIEADAPEEEPTRTRGRRIVGWPN